MCRIVVKWWIAEGYQIGWNRTKTKPPSSIIWGAVGGETITAKITRSRFSVDFCPAPLCSCCQNQGPVVIYYVALPFNASKADSRRERRSNARTAPPRFGARKLCRTISPTRASSSSRAGATSISANSATPSSSKHLARCRMICTSEPADRVGAVR